MLRMFRELKGSYRYIVLIFALLFGQAFCDLALPSYTSDIINVGVQQGGKFFQPARELRISALMANLPDKVSVDISSLGLEKKLRASDISLKDVTIVSDKDTIICGVKATRNSAAAAA